MTSATPTQTILVKDLSTKSVTLYPSRAYIVRDIHNVALQPGINEIEIYGLSPTIDENSVQVDGKGAATVVDMAVELVPNRDVFEEVYPEHDDDENHSSDDEAIRETSDDESSPTRKLAIEIDGLKSELAEFNEVLASSRCRLTSMDNYVKSLTVNTSSPDNIHKILMSHEQERAAAFKTSSQATTEISLLEKKLRQKERELVAAGRDARKTEASRQKTREKERKQKERRKAEKVNAAWFEKMERLKYWPKKVYRVVLQLETNTVYTPSSSRRGSVGSATISCPPEDEPMDGGDHIKTSISGSNTVVSLSLSYVTKEAAWVPRFDIEVSSTQKSAIIVYRTEFTNHTSETWKDAKVSFSTSQTSYQGLKDSIPQITSWRVKLTPNETGEDFGLLSFQEKNTPRHGRSNVNIFDRHLYFGKDNDYALPISNGFGHFQTLPQQQQQMRAQQQAQQMQQQQMVNPSSMTNTSNHALQDYQMQLMLLEQQNKKRTFMARQEQQPIESISAGVEAGALENFDFDSFLHAPPMEFSEPIWEDNGLTTTFEIPNTRTLAPGSQVRRHKIASLRAANIDLSYIAIPKLRNAAFLLAKVRNPSSNITLLKGAAGVTLDGSYLGSMPLPQVSPGQTFQLSLGVDPGIQIAYPKPSTRRTTQGIFNKERSQVYTRNIWLTNSKKTAVELVVLEQIPVSEDERLRVEITSPRGLHAEGDVAENVSISAKDVVSGGTRASVDAKNKKKTHSALARMKKNGEIAFAVNLDAGAGCLLKLEYEAKMPINEQITTA